MFDIITLILVIVSLCCLSIRIIFTIKMYKHPLPEIKAPDNNLSTSKLEKIVTSFKNKLNLKEWNVVQDDSNKYYGICNNVNFKKKTITVSKMPVPSIGYEIDNLLGNIWFASKIISGDKKLRRLLILNNIFIPLFRILYLAFFSFQIVLYCIYKFDNHFIYSSSILINLVDRGIIFYTCLLLLIVLALIQIIIFGTKPDLEINYEKDLALFISNDCKEYSQDILAARTYALEWNSFVVPIFIKKVSALKYLGPFVIFS